MKVANVLSWFYGGQISKQGTKMLGIGPFWMESAPTQSLTLHMHYTALDEDTRPNLLQILPLLPISINCGTFWNHTGIRKRTIKIEEFFATFGYIVRTKDKLMRKSIQSNIYSTTLPEHGTINNNMLSGLVKDLFIRWMVQPIGNTSLQCRSAGSI